MKTITITRTSTPRIGSRNWARSIKGEWSATRVTFGDCSTGWQIRCGEMPIAVILDRTPEGCEVTEMLHAMDYAGGRFDIGIALYRDLVAAVAPLTAEADAADDSEPVTLRAS